MTAKPAQQPDTLVTSLQSEVAAEASPLLTFLVAHAAKIVLGIVLFIAAIGGYWFFSAQSESKRLEEVKELGQILIVSDPKLRLEKLEAFVTSAPASVQGAAWFEILNTAASLQDNAKIYAAWERISQLDASLRVPAGLGMANALAAQGKQREALDVLTGLSVGAQSPDVMNVQPQIILLAELVGDYKQAVAACDVLMTVPGANPEETKIWGQKKAELEQKASGAAK